MRFSVVAPNLNEMPHFRDMFLESLKNQTFKDFEVIVVDGFSIDGSKYAVARYKKKGLNIKWVIDTKRNIGYIRNVGVEYAQGELVLHTSSDIEFPVDLLEKLDNIFMDDKTLIAVGGRTHPVGNIGVVCKLAYWGFDHLRWFFTSGLVPKRFHKMRPAGNFLCIDRLIFHSLGGYPEVRINEDGLFGYKLDDLCNNRDEITCKFMRDIGVKHHVKRFEEKGGLGGIMYYLYVFGLFFPWLNRWLAPLEEKRAVEFSTRSDLKRKAVGIGE